MTNEQNALRDTISRTLASFAERRLPSRSGMLLIGA